MGLALGFPISDKWGIQVGAGWSRKGYRIDCEPSLWETTCGLKIDLFESTILLDRRVDLGGPVLHLMAGPFVGSALTQEDCLHLWDCSLPWDYGVALGAQLDVALFGNMRLSAGPLYAHGLRTSNAFVSRAENTRTRTLTMRTGLSYPIR